MKQALLLTLALSCATIPLLAQNVAAQSDLRTIQRPRTAQQPVYRPPAQPTRPRQTRPPQQGRPRVARPAAPTATAQSRSAEGFVWSRVDLHWNLLFQSAGAYSSAIGFAFVPRYQMNSGYALGVTAGTQMAKSADGGSMALAEIGTFFEAPIGGDFFVKPELGVASAIPRPTVAGAKTAFPYFGAGLGYRLPGPGLFRNISFQYHSLASDTKAQQILLGVGIGW